MESADLVDRSPQSGAPAVESDPAEQAVAIEAVIRQRLGEAQGPIVILEELRRINESQFDPPWTDDALQEHIARALNGKADAQVIAGAPAINEQDSPEQSSWHPVDLAPILAGHKPDDPPELLRRADGVGLIYRGRLHSISAEPEAGKGWLALTAARDVLNAGGPVLYVDYEDTPNSIVSRLQALGVPEDLLVGGRFSYVRPDEPLNDQALAPLLSIHPELVVIDGVTEALAVERLNMADNQDVAKWLNGLARTFTRAGAAVVLIDHVVKDKENRGRYAIGAQHKLAGVDVAYRLDVIHALGRGREGLVKVTVTKDRPGYVRQHAVDRERIAVFRMSPATDGTVRTALERPEPGGSDSSRPTFLMERVSRAIEAEAGITKNGVRKVSGNNHYKDIALELLVSEGYVEPRQDGQAIRHYSQRPYRQDTDPVAAQGMQADHETPE